MFRPGLTGPDKPTEMHAAGDATFSILTEVIATCQRAGVAPSGELLLLAALVWAAAHGLAAHAPPVTSGWRSRSRIRARRTPASRHPPAGSSRSSAVRGRLTPKSEAAPHLSSVAFALLTHRHQSTPAPALLTHVHRMVRRREQCKGGTRACCRRRVPYTEGWILLDRRAAPRYPWTDNAAR